MHHLYTGHNINEKPNVTFRKDDQINNCRCSAKERKKNDSHQNFKKNGNELKLHRKHTCGLKKHRHRRLLHQRSRMRFESREILRQHRKRPQRHEPHLILRRNKCISHSASLNEHANWKHGVCTTDDKNMTPTKSELPMLQDFRT